MQLFDCKKLFSIKENKDDKRNFIVVSKKIIPKAVDRNRIRRRIKHVLEEERGKKNYKVLVRGGINQLSAKELRFCIKKMIQ